VEGCVDGGDGGSLVVEGFDETADDGNDLERIVAEESLICGDAFDRLFDRVGRLTVVGGWGCLAVADDAVMFNADDHANNVATGRTSALSGDAERVAGVYRNSTGGQFHDETRVPHRFKVFHDRPLKCIGRFTWWGGLPLAGMMM
jgi:hypothetical protein